MEKEVKDKKGDDIRLSFAFCHVAEFYVAKLGRRVNDYIEWG